MSPTSQAVDGVRAPTDSSSPVTGGRAHDHLVALEQPNRGASGLEQLDGGAHGDVEQVVRIELAGELDAGAREPLRERAGAALALVQLAPLERAAGRTGDVARQLELLVAEHRLAAEEDDHEPEPVTGRLDERNREQRVAVRLLGGLREPGGEAAVVAEPARGEHLARPAPALSGPRPPPADRSARPRSRLWAPASSSSSPPERSTAAESPPSASAAAWATASSVASADNGSLSTDAIR